MKTITKTKKLTESSLLIAMATVLSLIKIWNMPWGGSVTLLSMLPIIVLSVRYGTKQGLFVSLIFSVIQLMSGIFFDGLLAWGLTPVMLISCIMCDYIIAFTVIGLAGLFKNKGIYGIMMGTFIAVALRFLAHVSSGIFIFASAGKLWDGFSTDNTVIYSLVYNGCYMLPELIFTLVGVYFLYKAPKTSEFLKGN